MAPTTVLVLVALLCVVPFVFSCTDNETYRASPSCDWGCTDRKICMMQAGCYCKMGYKRDIDGMGICVQPRDCTDHALWMVTHPIAEISRFYDDFWGTLIDFVTAFGRLPSRAISMVISNSDVGATISSKRLWVPPIFDMPRGTLDP